MRDSINTIFGALTDAMGKEAVWASDGCSIDYRMSGIYGKTDRTPRVVIIYPDEDADPKIYIYSYPPDDLTLGDWVKRMEQHFEEYYDKKLGGSKRTNTNMTVPKTPHYLEDRMTAFGRSYRNMKHLDEDYPDFLKQLTDHAVKTIDAQRGRRERGRTREKGEEMQTRLIKMMRNRREKNKRREESRRRERDKRREKAKRRESHPPQKNSTK